MTIDKAFTKLMSLTDVQLEHFIQLVRADIVSYEEGSANYLPERMEEFGKPHLARLQSRLKSFEDELVFRRS